MFIPTLSLIKLTPTSPQVYTSASAPVYDLGSLTEVTRRLHCSFFDSVTVIPFKELLPTSKRVQGIRVTQHTSCAVRRFAPYISASRVTFGYWTLRAFRLVFVCHAIRALQPKFGLWAKGVAFGTSLSRIRTWVLSLESVAAT